MIRANDDDRDGVDVDVDVARRIHVDLTLREMEEMGCVCRYLHYGRVRKSSLCVCRQMVEGE